ncbi:VOC family protein [Luteimicrobium sp. NPDC057192]|uniref:VOC family protein n=1 Tax=Luteimicrobium sp. NPDC057192 TaxID=3346042 RepID=UPI00363896C2
MAAVTLLVRDLDLMTRYYRDALSLDVLDDAVVPDVLASPEALGAGGAGSARRETVVLGRGSVPVVVLRREPALPLARRGEAGLFHTAVLFDDAPALAQALASVARTAPGTFVGSADHLVSEAFYFTDPEGNGVELYHDRPRDLWAWDEQPDGRREVRMDTLHLDPNDFMGTHLPSAGDAGAAAVGGAAGAVVGHVHLKVGDVDAARGFYVGTLGFEETARVPGALFVSAGGYHHHLAANTWQSRGAGPRASTLGLGTVAVRLPSDDAVTALADRLRHAGVATRHDGAALRFEDPWSNVIEVVGA